MRLSLDHTQSKLQALKAIPAQKRRTKILSTVFGVLVFVGAFFLPKYLGFTWQVAVGVAAFGGWLISRDMVVTFLTVVPAFIRDVVRALHGNGGTDGAGPQS